MVPPRFFSDRRGILGMYIEYSSLSIICHLFRRSGLAVRLGWAICGASTDAPTICGASSDACLLRCT